MTMTNAYLEGLGVVEVDGSATFGGEDGGLLEKLVVSAFTIVAGAVVAGWPDFKQGLSDGFSGGASGTW